MRYFWPLLIIGQLYAQTDVLPEGETAFVQAMAIERSGDLDRAIKIYYQILTGDPNHQRAYLQLRNIYTRTGDSESAIPIIENWLKYHPEDLQSELILGEFHYRNPGSYTHLTLPTLCSV